MACFRELGEGLERGNAESGNVFFGGRREWVRRVVIGF